MIIPTVVIRLLFILPLFLLGLLTSYTDFKYGKIKNKHLLAGYIYVLCFYLFLAIYSIYLVQQPDNLRYLVNLAVNGLIALAAGYFLWRIDLWAAGDAKLFGLLAFLIPLEVYSSNYVSYFPAVVLLADAFLFIFILFVISLFYKIILFGKKIINSLESTPNQGRLPGLVSALGISGRSVRVFLIETARLFAVCACALTIMEFIGFAARTSSFSFISLDPVFSRAIFIISQILLFKVFGKYVWFARGLMILGAIFGLALLLFGQAGLLLSTIQSSFWLLLFMGVGMQLVYSHIESQEIAKVRINNLAPGMFLTPEAALVLNEIIESKSQAEPVALCCSDGLTRSQVDYLKTAFAGEPETFTSIYKTFSFAPFMFLACIYNVLVQKSFLFSLLGK